MFYRAVLQEINSSQYPREWRNLIKQYEKKLQRIFLSPDDPMYFDV